MQIKPLRKFKPHMRPEQKAALQLAAAQSGMSVSSLGRRIVDTALSKVETDTCKALKNSDNGLG